MCPNRAEFRLTLFAAVCASHYEWIRSHGYQWTAERIEEEDVA